eukprot:6134632-Prymnesium_polylepis.1
MARSSTHGTTWARGLDVGGGADYHQTAPGVPRAVSSVRSLRVFYSTMLYLLPFYHGILGGESQRSEDDDGTARTAGPGTPGRTLCRRRKA